MGWFEGSILFVVALITFAVILPVATALLPEIRSTLGDTVVTMISAMLVIILVSAFFVYIRQSQRPDDFGGSIEGDQYQ